MPSAPRAPGIRPVDPARVRAAVVAEWRALAAFTSALTPAELAGPSGLTGWTLADLVGHIAAGIEAVPRWLAMPEPDGPPITVEQWAGGTAAAAEAISDMAQEMAAAKRTPADYVDQAAALAAETPETRISVTRIGPMRVPDMLITRLIEAVVHADDLERATGTAFPHDRQALAVVTRVLADILAVRAPGHSVEVRIPPFAVVQCVTGPKHTRGTPPNVVETDARTWLRLAAGRLTWENAVEDGSVRASGERADLAGWLPLLG
ncbi:maleylpyruvate isomerase family mycothiol-dependent enzyme [Yinghuangia soli]|uniref:Maleylpyruvate isomerase family mycothiol-dependent enzyme n=1 Tax=Yinghuangia soli TaxID=2908204 RepID=A0AA41PWM2_9ACTN|nr:maleylpyruvate isomerase family mycothiol-dependent enzyme [Yinghuangia soli]MCF2526685.1 maleylpyruvate isomerase family mycothiol-dependent enzyme [Yinghuangia soli]